MSLRKRTEQISKIKTNTPEVMGILYETNEGGWFRNERSIGIYRGECGMSERERLVELLSKAPIGYTTLDNKYYKSTIEKIADNLLENGVIVPPVKVGQTVYYIGGMYHHLIKSAMVEAFDVNQDGVCELYVCSENGIYFQDKVDKFYLSKSEAEKALKGGATNE